MNIINIFVCINVNIYIYTYINIYINIYTYQYTNKLYIHLYLYTHIYMYMKKSYFQGLYGGNVETIPSHRQYLPRVPSKHIKRPQF